MKRREFILALGGAAAASANLWPLAALAQQPDREKRIGVLMPFAATDPSIKRQVAAFVRQLQDLGWAEGRNLQIDYRFAAGDAERMQVLAKELVALQPHVIFCRSTPVTAALLKQTRTIPIVFAVVSDPVGDHFVESLARPGGNITGFQNFETAIGGKWLELLKEIAPGVRRVAVVYNQKIAANVAFLHTAEAAASMGVTVTAMDLQDVAAIEPAFTAFAHEPNGGLILTPNPLNSRYTEVISGLAARLHLPAIYPFRLDPVKGGLVSYGFDTVEQQRGAAAYVDRVLKGEKPANLPVQAPTKYQLVINLKTAKALGLDVSLQIQQRADEVIE